jgi:hypothetical protein
MNGADARMIAQDMGLQQRTSRFKHGAASDS